MLEGMPRRRVEIVPLVGDFHTDIVGDNIVVDTGDIHTLCKRVVIDGEAGYFLHIKPISPLLALRCFPPFRARPS